MSWWKRKGREDEFSEKESEQGAYSDKSEHVGEFREKALADGVFAGVEQSEIRSVERERGVASEGRQGEDSLGVVQALFYVRAEAVWQDIAPLDDSSWVFPRIPWQDEISADDFHTVQLALASVDNSFLAGESFHVQPIIPREDELATREVEAWNQKEWRGFEHPYGDLGYGEQHYGGKEVIFPVDDVRLEVSVPWQDAVEVGKDAWQLWKADAMIPREEAVLTGEQIALSVGKVFREDIYLADSFSKASVKVHWEGIDAVDFSGTFWARGSVDRLDGVEVGQVEFRKDKYIDQPESVSVSAPGGTYGLKGFGELTYGSSNAILNPEK